MGKQLPRGIAPDLLLSQIKNTMPYLFEPEARSSALSCLRPAQIVLAFAEDPGRELTHLEYFSLCLSAHYLTVGTPVPTDVDNQIRLKLWPRQLPLETAVEMAKLVLESRSFDFTLLSTRYTYGPPGTPVEREALSGHNGEWFTVACGAYCALGQYSDAQAKELRDRLYESIADEVNRHSEVFGALWRAKDGLKCLTASASIAHNLGDLDRVMDMWELDVGDRLRLEFYKLGAKPFDTRGKLRYLGRLWVAGELYKSVIDGGSMSYENHRHFALRKPKCLRLRPEYLVPIAPFLDEWGRKVARGLATPQGKPSGDTMEVVEALKFGSSKLPNTVGYKRALRAMAEIHPELAEGSLPTQEKFERRWAEEALRLMDDIPSRAQ